MGRLARIVVPDTPHHVTERASAVSSAETGNPRSDIYDVPADRLGKGKASGTFSSLHG